MTETRPRAGPILSTHYSTGQGVHMAASRSSVREGISIDHKVALLENDADVFEAVTRTIVTRMNAILVSLATGAVLLALNLGVQLAGR